MDIHGIIWLDKILDKILVKHNVQQHEVREVLLSNPYIRFVEKGDYNNEHVYSAQGKTESGRYLIVFFVYKRNRSALILSAREMTRKERNIYEQA